MRFVSDRQQLEAVSVYFCEREGKDLDIFII